MALRGRLRPSVVPFRRECGGPRRGGAFADCRICKARSPQHAGRGRGRGKRAPRKVALSLSSVVVAAAAAGIVVGYVKWVCPPPHLHPVTPMPLQLRYGVWRYAFSLCARPTGASSANRGRKTPETGALRALKARTISSSAGCLPVPQAQASEREQAPSRTAGRKAQPRRTRCGVRNAGVGAGDCAPTLSSPPLPSGLS